ncbi:GDSL-type esterase/lipase family protein [Clostridium ljungdahlii]|uniref:GDSL-type esterase/lipase family protein n=1 Tax=Clostridium ljungdahlii TaxID=1538 RepID=UPI00386E6B2C
MKMVCIGDSLTAGYGVSNSECFVSILREKLQIDILNKGVCGDTASGLLSRSYKDVIQNNPSHVLIMVGCNDFMTGRYLKLVTDNLKEIIKESLSAKIITIIGIEPLVYKKLAKEKWDSTLDYEKVSELESEYRNWIIDFCTKNSLFYADFYSCFQEKLETNTKDDLFIDGIHPTALGHKLIAECIQKTLTLIEAQNVYKKILTFKEVHKK